MTFADDAGEYSIFVKNPHGEVSASASLLEEGIRRPFIRVPHVLLDQWLTVFLHFQNNMKPS